MEKDNSMHKIANGINTMLCNSLSCQPTHIKTTIEGRVFLVKAPIDLHDPKALYYAGIMDLLDKKHSFAYYLWDFFESNCA